MTTRKMQAARKASKVVTAKVKQPTKAALERRGKIALLSAATRKANANEVDALIFKACDSVGKATQDKLALGLCFNRMFQDECRELGIAHWSLATADNCPGANSKSLLQRIEFQLAEVRRVNYELVLKGKGDSNVNRILGDIKRLAYEAIFGAKPRTTVAKDVSDDTRAAMIKRYKAYMAIDADSITEMQLNECRYIGQGLVTLFNVDLAKINTKN